MQLTHMEYLSTRALMGTGTYSTTVLGPGYLGKKHTTSKTLMMTNPYDDDYL